MTETLRLAQHQKVITKPWAELLQQQEDSRTPEQILDDVLTNMGLEVIDA